MVVQVGSTVSVRVRQKLGSEKEFELKRQDKGVVDAMINLESALSKAFEELQDIHDGIFSRSQSCESVENVSRGRENTSRGLGSRAPSASGKFPQRFSRMGRLRNLDVNS